MELEREMWDTAPLSDLAAERRRADLTLPGVEYKKEKCVAGEWEWIRISSEEGAESIGRPMGHYDTLNIQRMDRIDRDGEEDAQDEIARHLCHMCDRLRIYPERILVVGLGNRELTPDAVGPRAVSGVEATMHLHRSQRELFDGLESSSIATFEPGVEANTGIDSKEAVRGICERVRPDIVIAIDSMAAKDPVRLGTTLQFSDTGIRPGTGLGMRRGAIDRDSLGVPVIAIGVPTVIDARLLCPRRDIGELYVSPKDVSAIVESAGRIISGGINQAFGIFI